MIKIEELNLLIVEHLKPLNPYGKPALEDVKKFYAEGIFDKICNVAAIDKSERTK